MLVRFHVKVGVVIYAEILAAGKLRTEPSLAEQRLHNDRYTRRMNGAMLEEGPLNASELLGMGKIQWTDL